MINSRSLDDLLLPVKLKAVAFVAECAKQHIDVLITSTYRDIESQNALYAQGRTTAGSIVTNAKGGQSFHNWKCAFDFVPIVSGKAQWEDKATFQKCGAIAKQVGLEWAGDWVKFKEMAHCQYTGGLTLSDLQNDKKIS